MGGCQVVKGVLVEGGGGVAGGNPVHFKDELQQMKEELLGLRSRECVSLRAARRVTLQHPGCTAAVRCHSSCSSPHHQAPPPTR